MTPLTKDTVKESFLKLLEDKRSTTSLDVKNDLRGKGFYAKQDEVTNLMREIADEESISFTFNGTFRTYTNEDNTDEDEKENETDDSLIPSKTSLSQTTAQTTLQKKKKIKNIINPSDRAPISSPMNNGWEVRDVKGSSPNLYFNDKLNSGQAKHAYSQITGVYFTNTRTKRIK
jgi:hypothetical protein